MDPIKTLGTILKGNEQRDCVHIAIMPCIAAEPLYRGSPVGLVYGAKDQVKNMDRVYDLPAIGVVDPFLRDYRVEKGQRIWVFLFPGSITGLRHAWTHPVIDDPIIAKTESEDWLRRFADKWDFDYDRMIQEAQIEEGCVVAMGKDLHGRDELHAGDEKLFWEHLSNLTGREYSEDHRVKFGWSCSC